ncbi:MAG TPA: 6-pyruvoyl-tetrahydropterin synthase-related protein [Candidatus Sulfotelmatobacter sp.]|jgi:hypothetical protein|nr:6-pyruvoyl-tetrahydropterin synthase-related protein [Candidatus Sulfotelmatobacter sp.]
MSFDFSKSSHSLVLTSIIASIILLIGLLIYHFVFPKKRIHPVAFLILISLLPLVSIFRIGSYESGDLSFHTMRTISFYHLLFVEHSIPRWSPELNVGYGDPYFLFSYIFPYVLGSLLHFIGFSYLMSIKLLLALSFIFSGIIMYIWAKNEFGGKSGLVSAIFYLFVPYHLIDLHFRVSIAETLSFTFLPLILLLTKRVITSPTIVSSIMFAISYCLLILTHQVIALSFLPISILYGLLIWKMKIKKRYKELVIYCLSILLGILLAIFYWLPILVEAKYIRVSIAKSLSIFTTFPELIYAPWRLGFLFQGPHGELSYLIGYTQLLIVVMAIYLLIKHQLNKYQTKLLIFILILFCLLVFLMLPLAQPIWQIIPFLQYFQFSYRLLELVALCTSVLAGIVVIKWNNNIFIIILCFLTIFYTMLNWGNRRAITTIDDAYLIQQTYSQPEGKMSLEPSSPKWADLQKSKLRIRPTSHLQILSGKAQIQELLHTSLDHKYIIQANSTVKMKENTLYFPGWTLFIDGKEHAITYTDKVSPGVIIFTLNKGLHEIELIYQDTPDRKYAMDISVITATFTFFLLVFSLIKKFIPK